MTEMTADLRDKAREARCGLVRAWVTSPAVTIPAAAERHVEHCVPCRAEVAREQSIVRLLGEFRHMVEAAPPDLAGSIRRAIEADLPDWRPAPKPVSWRQRAVALSAISALAVASIAALRRLRTVTA